MLKEQAPRYLSISYLAQRNGHLIGVFFDLARQNVVFADDHFLGHARIGNRSYVKRE